MPLDTLDTKLNVIVRFKWRALAGACTIFRMVKPAKREDDHKLFDHAPPAVRKLNAQARKELREQERKKYAREFMRKVNQ